MERFNMVAVRQKVSGIWYTDIKYYENSVNGNYFENARIYRNISYPAGDYSNGVYVKAQARADNTYSWGKVDAYYNDNYLRSDYLTINLPPAGRSLC